MAKLTHFLARGVAVVLATLLALLVLLAAAETLAWALFEKSWPATGEITGILMIWFGLLGAAYGVHQRIHLGVEVLVARLAARWRLRIARLSALLVALFGVLLAIYGARLVQSVGNTLPATGWPASMHYLPAVIGGTLIAWFAADELWFGTPERQAEEER